VTAALATPFEALAALLAYPESDYGQRLSAARAALDESATHDAAACLDAFAARIDGMSLEELQERFTGSFDLNPTCTLDLGWHLFGEQYERGAFLVEIRDALREQGIPESSELPDHLTHVLTLLGRLEPDRAEALAVRAVRPALDRILAGVTERENPFADLLRAAAALAAHPGRPS
jgi:nitrate reductase delta subunit